MVKYTIELRKIHILEIIPAEYNPRVDLQIGDAAYESLARSLEEFGYVDPIIWNEQTKHIVGGHQRFKVLKERGLEYIDCVVINLPLEREMALNVTLNKVQGEFDIPKLINLLNNLEDIGMSLSLTGFTTEEFDELKKKNVKKEKGILTEDDFDVDSATEESENPITQRGDVWLLGKHRLMCGDSTIYEDVAKLMGGKKARHVFADPPWNVNFGGSNHPTWKKRSILNDNMSSEDFYNLLLSTFKNMSVFCETGTPIYIAMSSQEWHNVHRALLESGFHWSSTIIWYKNSLVISRKDYHTIYEPIWYGWLKGAACLKHLEDKQQTDVWEIPRPSKSKLHPTMKPIALVGRTVENSSNKGDIVLDLFGGSGSTLIACEQLERVNYSMELSPQYCDVICQRYHNEKEGNAEIFLLRDGEKINYLDVPKPPPPESESVELAESETAETVMGTESMNG